MELFNKVKDAITVVDKTLGTVLPAKEGAQASEVFIATTSIGTAAAAILGDMATLKVEQAYEDFVTNSSVEMVAGAALIIKDVAKVEAEKTIEAINEHVKQVVKGTSFVAGLAAIVAKHSIKSIKEEGLLNTATMVVGLVDEDPLDR